jgi:hypothetical protein
VWACVILTAALFEVGKFLIGLYIEAGGSNPPTERLARVASWTADWWAVFDEPAASAGEIWLASGTSSAISRFGEDYVPKDDAHANHG